MIQSKKISRRRFIWIVLVSLVTAFVGSFLFFDFNQVVVKILSKDLSYLNIDESTFRTFTIEADQKQHWQRKFFDWKKKLFMRFSYIADSVLPSFPYKYKFIQYRSDIVGDFLLSTNFFINKMDPKQEVKYMGLYNPYLRPCSNPFSNLYYPEA